MNRPRSQGALLLRLQTREKWFMPIFLLLLIPSLLNLFLVFNGPVAVKGDHHATNHQGAQGGKDVTSTSSGPISTTPMYTISQTAYRQRLQGGSYAVVYTDENGADGKIKVAGIGMFHQLHCLNGSRSVIQQLQASNRIGYSVFTDVSEHRATAPLLRLPSLSHSVQLTILSRRVLSMAVSGVSRVMTLPVYVRIIRDYMTLRHAEGEGARARSIDIARKG